MHEAINQLSPRTCCKQPSLLPQKWSWLDDLTSASSEKLPRAFCRLTLQQARIRSHVRLVRQNAFRRPAGQDGLWVSSRERKQTRG